MKRLILNNIIGRILKINEAFNISEKKVRALMVKIEELGIILDDIDESFTRGSGKGGQKVNKTSNAVSLHHKPTGMRVTCQRERERNKNRFIALRSLVEKIEEQMNPGSSKASKEAEKIRKQKSRRKRRNKKDEQSSTDITA